MQHIENNVTLAPAEAEKAKGGPPPLPGGHPRCQFQVFAPMPINDAQAAVRMTDEVICNDLAAFQYRTKEMKQAATFDPKTFGGMATVECEKLTWVCLAHGDGERSRGKCPDEAVVKGSLRCTVEAGCTRPPVTRIQSSFAGKQLACELHQGGPAKIERPQEVAVAR